MLFRSTLTSGSGISPGRSFVSIAVEVDKMGDKEKPPHEIKENGYVVIGGNLFPRKIMISPRKTGVNLVRSILLTHKSSSRGRLLYFRSLHRCSSLRFYFLLFVLFHYFLFVLDIFFRYARAYRHTDSFAPG